MTSSPHGLYAQGCTRATMATVQNDAISRDGANRKSRPQFGLEVCNSTSMKSESLVIADQLRRGEYVPEPCTHRPSQSWKLVLAPTEVR